MFTVFSPIVYDEDGDISLGNRQEGPMEMAWFYWALKPHESDGLKVLIGLWTSGAGVESQNDWEGW